MFSESIRQWSRCSLALTLAIGCTLFFSDIPSFALDVLRIEEHWELSVGGPDEARCAPQVSMVMAPTSNLNSDYFVFSLNHWSYPEFSPGGLEVQQWDGEQWVSSHHGTNFSLLQSDGEIVTWIQRLELTGSLLSFEIVDGHSQTWGQFGGQGHLRVVAPTELTCLNDYRPSVSFDGSGIGYAGNRVSSLTLRKLVWVTSDGVEHELAAPIDIDTDIDP
ncbi:MAG: hypothetical protein KDA57_16450 [Planctomycetales bacterium]|nr:hypothetical protein [Planctomycetales bacterium]